VDNSFDLVPVEEGDSVEINNDELFTQPRLGKGKETGT
jgi:hypothetical protein